VSAEVNLLKNAAFAEGEEQPRAWRFVADAPGARWERNSGDPAPSPCAARTVARASRPCGYAGGQSAQERDDRKGSAGASHAARHGQDARATTHAPAGSRREVAGGEHGRVGVTLIGAGAEGRAGFVQEVRCKPGEFYRVEADVACRLEAVGADGGLVLMLETLPPGRGAGDVLQTPPVTGAGYPVTVAARFEAPAEVRRVRMGVFLRDARGAARVEQVRFIRILEPDETSNMLAIAPPAGVLRPPRVARRVCVCSAHAETRPLTAILRAALGARQVRAAAPASFTVADATADAVLLPDALPPALRSLKALLKLAEERYVIVSLPAFARLAGSALKLRRIEQDDDPIHAKVAFANYATRGFVLHDVFPHAWAGRQPGSFVQHQFQRSAACKAFCARHGFETLLLSMCDRESTSDQPISLFRLMERGGLFVLDMEPLEAAASTVGSPTPAAHLLLSILGHTQAPLGQYVVPQASEARLREELREFAWRFPGVVVHDADVPADKVTEQLVTLGQADQTYGLALQPKPMILLRSGLTAGDFESVYAAWAWLKQLVRPEPYRCPYVEPLARRFRIAWEPCAAPWEPRCGWRRTDRPARRAWPRLPEETPLAALIEVVSRPVNRVRVLLPADGEAFERHAAWLPLLAEAFLPGAQAAFGFTVPDGAGFADRDAFAWRRVAHQVEVRVDPGLVHEDRVRPAMTAGALVVRLEVPGGDGQYSAQSILRTDVAATVLEHVIGLQYGLLAVNRTGAPVRVDGFAPVAPGSALVVPHEDPLLRAWAARAG